MFLVKKDGDVTNRIFLIAVLDVITITHICDVKTKLIGFGFYMIRSYEITEKRKMKAAWSLLLYLNIRHDL